MVYNESIKHSIMSWREQNKDKYNEICKRGSSKYYYNNRELAKKKNLANYYLKKEWHRLLAIDL